MEVRIDGFGSFPIVGVYIELRLWNNWNNFSKSIVVRHSKIVGTRIERNYHSRCIKTAAHHFWWTSIGLSISEYNLCKHLLNIHYYAFYGQAQKLASPYCCSTWMCPIFVVTVTWISTITLAYKVSFLESKAVMC